MGGHTLSPSSQFAICGLRLFGFGAWRVARMSGRGARDQRDVKAGDVLLFRWKSYLPAKHAGIATSSDTMIHAQDGVGVVEVALSKWWQRRVAFVFRFPV
jgi:NlpC/P60 family putative phage cell wall peptidase